MEFFERSKSSVIQVIGSSAANLQDTVCFVGGLCTENDVHLQIRCLDIITASWKPYFVNSNGIRNRYFHSCASINENLFVFGGCISNDANAKKVVETTGDILVMNKSIFGIEVNVHSTNAAASRQGLTASNVGERLDKVVIFGGYSNKPSESKAIYSSDVMLFCVDSTGKMVFKTIEIDKTTTGPVNRAFHSSCVIGDKNQYLLICGGHNDHKSTLLSDVWLLDLTEIINAEDNKDTPPPVVVVDPKAKPSKASAKDAAQVKVPTAYWTKLLAESTTCVGRYLHSSYVATTTISDNDFKLCVFGGISTNGALPLSSIYELSILKDVTTKKFSASGDFSLSHSNNNSNSTFAHVDSAHNYCGYGGVTVAVHSTAGPLSDSSVESSNRGSVSPAAVLIIGGARETVRRSRHATPIECISYMVVLDEQSATVKKIRRAVIQNSQSTILGSASDNSTTDEPSNPVQTIEYPNGDVYSGQVAPSGNNSSSGNGALDKEYFPEEEKSTDAVLVPHGTGTMSYIGNDNYEGQWVQGVRHGTGTFTSADGSVYRGDYSDDRQSGQGELTSMDESGQSQTYVGSFVEGLYEGYGEMTYSNGNVYKGQYSQGRREGEGTLYSATNGGQLSGQWSNDELVGAGQVTSMPIESLNTILSHSTNALLARGIMAATSNGGSYKHLVHDTINSRTTSSKGFYTGPVVDGLPSGESGECRYEDGSQYNGAWRGGRRNGTGSYVFPNQDEYTGKWVGDKRCGFGTLKSSINPCYEGIWEDNLPQGLGMLLLRDGKAFHGEFVRGKRSGQGKLCYAHDADGPPIYEGLWVNDNPAGGDISPMRK